MTSNGLILIGAHDEDGCRFGLPIPQEDHLDGLIAMGWGDLIPSIEHGFPGMFLERSPIERCGSATITSPHTVVKTMWSLRPPHSRRLKRLRHFHPSIVYDEPMTVGLESPNGQVAVVVKENHSARPIVLERAAYRYTASVPQ